MRIRFKNLAIQGTDSRADESMYGNRELNFLIKCIKCQFGKNVKVSNATSNSRSFYTSPTFVAQSKHLEMRVS